MQIRHHFSRFHLQHDAPHGPQQVFDATGLSTLEDFHPVVFKKLRVLFIAARLIL